MAQVLDALRRNPARRREGMATGRLLNIFVSVCNALAYAHSRNVIHRDLKPANIMVGDFGEVYVMDWGLAKILKNETTTKTIPTLPSTPLPPAAVGSTNDVRSSRKANTDLTQEGDVMGTLTYIPPEQAQGQHGAINARSDVYALGAILYEILTLEPPVEKDGGFPAILMRVIHGKIKQPEERVPERARGGKIPRELSAVAMKALAWEKEARYPSAEASGVMWRLSGRAFRQRQDRYHSRGPLETG